MPAKLSKKQPYENNPFFIATSGITLLFDLAQGVAVMLIIFAVGGLFSGSFEWRDDITSNNSVITTLQSWSLTDWLLAVGAAAIIGLAIVMISALFSGVNAYTSARLANGNEVAIRTAFRESFDNLWGFVWLQIIILVKILLWSLLFIIPGIIMAVRYSLANVAFFDETKNLRGNAAVKESIRLTKNAWVTTYAANILFNILTFGVINKLVGTGTNAVLYKQYRQSGDKKPSAHWLSWLMLALPLILISFIIFAVATIAIISVLLP